MSKGQVSNGKNETIEDALRNQLRFEINGEELKNPEKFALEQKFGITDPVLTLGERQAIAAEGVQ